MLAELGAQLAALEARIKALEARLMARHRTDPRSQLLATIPGVGPIGAVSFALKVPDARAFRSGRHPGRRRGRLLPPGSGSRRASTPPPADNGSAGSADKAIRACAGCWCSAPPRSSSRPKPAAPRPLFKPGAGRG
jgi:hypothetical protein